MRYTKCVIPDALYQMHYIRRRFRVITPYKFRFINNIQTKGLQQISKNYKELEGIKRN